MTSYIVALLALTLTTPLAAQVVKEAHCGDDGRAHITYADGTSQVASPQPQQIGCDSLAIADGGRDVGWSVLVENCCTSYPIPISVVIQVNGKQTVVSPGQMVWKWHFVAKGDRIAVLRGPVHGWASAATLYETRSGKQIFSWNGMGAEPAWAEGWKQEFEPATDPAN